MTSVRNYWGFLLITGENEMLTQNAHELDFIAFKELMSLYILTGEKQVMEYVRVTRKQMNDIGVTLVGWGKK